MAAAAKGQPYTEAQAKAEMRAALVDIERGREQLRATMRSLEALPGFKRVAAEWEKDGRKADIYAASLAEELHYALQVLVKALDDDDEGIPLVRKALRETEASVAADAKRNRAEGARREKKRVAEEKRRAAEVARQGALMHKVVEQCDAVAVNLKALADRVEGKGQPAAVAR